MISATKGSSANRPDVLVIGAGPSGIATAWTLGQAGISSIVLEGRPDRIGGRVWSSYKWTEAPVDLGASWVTHLNINPLVEVARANKIKLAPSELLNLTLTQADGTQLSDSETAETIALYFELYGRVKLSAERRAQRGKPDISAAEGFARGIKEMKLSGQKLLNVEFFLNYSTAEPNAANLDDLSLYRWDDDYTQVMLALAVVPKGYVKVIEPLAKDLDIRLGHVVSHIHQDADEVTVTTNHGEFRAPYAVVTLPHGVLAKGPREKGSVRFSPLLPDWKRAAIRRIHTGLSDKFYFLFPNVFWKSNRDILGRIDETGQGRWSTWINFHRYTKLPILMCFNRNEHAVALEHMTDQAIVDEAMKVLCAEYGPRTPEPLKMQHSGWRADPLAGGTLPHVPPGSSGDDFKTLGRPVGRLRFAGDSTHPDFPGTVLGAFLSGVREGTKLSGLLYERVLNGKR
ncbi:MAG TPA: FAD-dependent oxidoreductase [Blastocatellia bacterium]|nr:FAD-dependent oxidoreductase [Blastocatellia bacterium]